MHKLTIQLLDLQVVHCESHRLHKQKKWQLCSIASLPSYTNRIFCSFKSHDRLLHFLLKFVPRQHVG